MNIEEFRDYCISKVAVTEDMPFDQSVLTFKVGGKIFALTNIDTFESINLKCDPKKALELRDQFSGIIPGYHMNKKHWNTVLINAEISDKKIRYLINHSYELVVAGLPKKLRMEINAEIKKQSKF